MPLVRYTRRGPAGWVTLDRPDQRNALTPELIGDLHRALDVADADPGVRALVVTGAGDAFCAGADLNYFLGKVSAPGGGESFIAELLLPLAAVLRRLRSSSRLVIAAVNGACFAGGIELLVACDLVVASDSAVFCDAHAQRGLRTLALSEVLTAAQLFGFGLVSEVVAADSLSSRVAELAAVAAERSPVSVAAMKQAVQRCEPRPWDEVVAEDIEPLDLGPEVMAGQL